AAKAKASQGCAIVGSLVRSRPSIEVRITNTAVRLRSTHSVETLQGQAVGVSTKGQGGVLIHNGLTLPSRGRATSGFACCRPPLTSNVRAHECTKPPLPDPKKLS